MTSLHFSGAVIGLRQTVALSEKTQYIMIGNGLVWKITCKKQNQALLNLKYTYNLSQF